MKKSIICRLSLSIQANLYTFIMYLILSVVIIVLGLKSYNSVFGK